MTGLYGQPTPAMAFDVVPMANSPRWVRLVDWIWHIRGQLAVPAERDTFADLGPMFQERGTRTERSGDTLWFRKRNPDAQDRLAIFDRGTLTIDRDQSGKVLRYDLKSPTLLFCFLLPLLFLAFGQLNLAIGKWEKASAEADAKLHPDKADKEDKAPKVLPQSPVDKFLGAPAPERPKKDGKEKKDDKRTATKAYVFASLFALLYLVGRFLEQWLVRRELRRHAGSAL